MVKAMGSVNGRERYNRYSSYNPSTRRIIARRKQMYRKMILSVLAAFVLIFSIMFLSVSFFSDAKNEKDNFKKYYSSVVVTAGDSIWSIAEEHMDPMHYRSTRNLVSEIASINKISTDANLQAGSCLIIPYFEEEENIK